MKRPYKITVQKEPHGEWHAFVFSETMGQMTHGKGKTPAEATLDLIRALIDSMEWPAITTPEWVAYRPNPNPTKPLTTTVERDDPDDKRIEEAMASGPHTVFVFESNKLGIHREGTALTAFARWGASQGRPEGRQGRAYAIPTMHSPARYGVHMQEIATHVRKLLAYAQARPESLFVVTRLGTQAGLPPTAIAPLFTDVPKNVILPIGWKDI